MMNKKLKLLGKFFATLEKITRVTTDFFRIENIASTLRKVIAEKEKELSDTSTSPNTKCQVNDSQGSENDYVQT